MPSVRAVGRVKRTAGRPLVVPPFPPSLQIRELVEGRDRVGRTRVAAGGRPPSDQTCDRTRYPPRPATVLPVAARTADRARQAEQRLRMSRLATGRCRTSADAWGRLRTDVTAGGGVGDRGARTSIGSLVMTYNARPGPRAETPGARGTVLCEARGGRVRSGRSARRSATRRRNSARTATIAAGCPGRIPHDLRRTAVRNMVRARRARARGDAADRPQDALGVRALQHRVATATCGPRPTQLRGLTGTKKGQSGTVSPRGESERCKFAK